MLGTSPDSIDLAEDRERWNDLCERLGIPQPAGGTATNVDEALAVASKVGYPVLVRPSYVLGGRAMEIVYDDQRLGEVVRELGGSFGSLEREGGVSAERPLLVDRFLEDAVEVDVDAVRDATGEVLIAGVMEHVEEAGVHSGDSACALPPQTLGEDVLGTIDTHTRAIAEALGVIGLVNVQFAVKDGDLLRPRGESAREPDGPVRCEGDGGATRNGRGAGDGREARSRSLRSEGLLTEPSDGGHVSVKEAVLPFGRFPGTDTLLGPEMRSTGEVMGIGENFRHRVRQEPDRSRHPPPRLRNRVHVPRRPGQGSRAWSWRRRFVASASRSPRRRAPRLTSLHEACRSRRSRPRSANLDPRTLQS